MKKYIVFSIFVMFLFGCEEIIPEYSPLYGEPTNENQIPEIQTLCVANDGTVWAISEEPVDEFDDAELRVYWIKDGQIWSQPTFENQFQSENGYGTLNDKFYYTQRKELVIHTSDTIKLVELPRVGDDEYDFYGTLYVTETLVAFFSYETESIYWILDGDRWVQKSTSYDLNWSLRNALSSGYFRNEYVYSDWNMAIYNMESNEYTTLDPTYIDEWGNTQSVSAIDIHDQCFDQQGNFYFIAAYYKLFRANRVSQSLEIIPVSVPGVDSDNLQVRRVFVGRNDDVWVVFRNTSNYDDGIYLLGSSSPHYIDNMDLGSVKQFADGNGMLWIIDNKLFGYDQNGLVTEYQVNFDMWTDNLLIKEDDSDAVWFGQYESGLHKYSNGIWYSFHQHFEEFEYWEK
ncbi:MAG TPA: hypothetical protein PK563_15280 [Tenuifilaceae bacterium]|nr:hypothetical protein [Tenuifilaceae bacterium]